MKDKILKYLKNNRHYWWTVGILPGVYAITYFYINNYYLVNSWTQLIGFVCYFIIIPSIAVLLISYLLKNKNNRIKTAFYASAFIMTTAIMLSLAVYQGWRWKALILLGIITIIASWFMGKHYKKLVIILGIMSVIGIGQLLYNYLTVISTKADWVKKMDFENTKFTKKPNIYLIQPDGYASKTALENTHYNYNNDSFYNELEESGFVFNHNYRSNYGSTLSSNTTLFTSQHHYYANGLIKSELPHARDIIMGDNPVLNTFKNNRYTTTAILQHRYLLLNHPNIGYDRINITASELSILPKYKLYKDYFNDLKEMIATSNDDPQFYFLEILHPSHITNSKYNNSSIENERNKYIKDLENINTTLISMVNHIQEHDPTAYIILAADHGGYVGYSYTIESMLQTTNDLSLKQGIFSSLYAIKAPDIHKDVLPVSSINVFPRLFSELSDDDTYNLEDNSSYQIIKKGADREVYQYYDNTGKSVLKKVK